MSFEVKCKMSIGVYKSISVSILSIVFETIDCPDLYQHTFT